MGDVVGTRGTSPTWSWEWDRKCGRSPLSERNCSEGRRPEIEYCAPRELVARAHDTAPITLGS
jgi:hypothetical protein